MTPATGVTTKRFVATCAVAFVVSEILSIAIHGFVLARDYAPFYGTLLRPMNQTADWRMLLLPVSHLSFIIAFVWVFVRIAPRGPWLREGLKFGVVAWAMGQVPLWLLWYAEQPWPDTLVGKQLGLEFIAALILGLTVAAMAGRATPSQAVS